MIFSSSVVIFLELLKIGRLSLNFDLLIMGYIPYILIRYIFSSDKISHFYG